MNKFSEAFDQAKSTLSIGALAGEVEKMRPSLGKLFGPDGLAPSEAAQLAILREALSGARQASMTSGGKGLGEACADSIRCAWTLWSNWRVPTQRQPQ